MSHNQSDQKLKIADLNERVVHEILEVISDGIWDWNANNGFVYRNSGWYEMLGYPVHAFENTVHTWEKLSIPMILSGSCFSLMPILIISPKDTR